MKVRCTICNKEFNISPSRYKKSLSKEFCCSRECDTKRRLSKTKLNVICDNCGKLFHKKDSHISKTNFCSRKCLGEYREKIYLGDSNPNKKYKFDINWFKDIDTEEKAWVLGWIASDGSLHKGGEIAIQIQQGDLRILELIRELICPSLPITLQHREGTNCQDIVTLRWCSKEMVDDICRHLQISPKKKSDIVRMPRNIGDLKWPFLRGYFEGGGHVSKHRSPYCKIYSNSKLMLEDIKTSIEIPSKIKGQDIYWCGVNCLDFLGKLYDNNSKYYLRRKKEVYENICCWEPRLDGPNNSTRIDNIYFAKTKDKAILPSKQRVSDSGYDLTIIEKIKTNGLVELYDTGIKVTPPFGYYFLVAPRSSISKSGYMLANSIGIIDRSYTGSIKVALIKVDKNAPDIELPCRIVQLIPQPIKHMNLIQVDSLEDTDRGDGGFGSTGK